MFVNNQEKNYDKIVIDELSVLLRLYDATGAINDSDLAKKLSVPRSSVGSWRDKNLPIGTMVKIAKSIGVTTDWLLFGEKPALPDIDNTNHLLIPKLSVVASAGGGAVVDQEHVMSHLAFKKAALKKQGLNARNLSAIDVVGDSMMPTLRDGDTVLVDTSNKMLKPEKIVVARMDGDLVVKRVRKLNKKGGWILQSDNPEYNLTPVDKSTAIIGRVVWHAHWLDK